MWLHVSSWRACWYGWWRLCRRAGIESRAWFGLSSLGGGLGMLPTVSFPCRHGWAKGIGGQVVSSWFKPRLHLVAGIHPAFSPKVKYLVANKDECRVVLAQLLGSSPGWGQKVEWCFVLSVCVSGLETRIQHVEAPWFQPRWTKDERCSSSGCGQKLFFYVCQYILLVFCHTFSIKPFFTHLLTPLQNVHSLHWWQSEVGATREWRGSRGGKKNCVPDFNLENLVTLRGTSKL